MRTTWILATALALGVSPTLSQAWEREHRERAEHRERGWSEHREHRSYESRHDSRRDRGFREFHRATRYRWVERSTHYHPSFLPTYRHGYFWSAGYYYPRYYFAYDSYPERASLRIQANPSQAEVYVDGHYAGIVDDFDGVFQRLHVTPGSHEITLRLEGFRTWSAEIYAAPGSTVKLHQDLIPGAAAEPDAYEN